MQLQLCLRRVVHEFQSGSMRNVTGGSRISYRNELVHEILLRSLLFFISLLFTPYSPPELVPLCSTVYVPIFSRLGKRNSPRGLTEVPNGPMQREHSRTLKNSLRPIQVVPCTWKDQRQSVLCISKRWLCITFKSREVRPVFYAFIAKALLHRLGL